MDFFKYLKTNLKETKKILEEKIIRGASPAERAVMAFLSNQKFIYIANDFSDANKIKRQLNSLNVKTEMIISGKEEHALNNDSFFPFVKNLNAFIFDEIQALVVMPHVILTKIPKSLENEFFDLEEGLEYDNFFLKNRLIEFGYTRVDIVASEGQFSIRGDIIDVFPLGGEEPLRFEFFGDALEKITYFSLENMKNTTRLTKFSLKCANYAQKAEISILDYANVIFADDTGRITNECKLLTESYKGEQDIVSLNELFNREIISFGFQGNVIRSLGSKNYILDYKALALDIMRNVSGGLTTILAMGNPHAKKRMCDFLSDNKISYGEEFSGNYRVIVIENYIPYSFSFIDDGIALIGSDDLVKRSGPARTGKKTNAFYLPKVGDYVVHSVHGIGRCEAIERMKLSDYEKDYFLISYDKGGILYLPSENANMITAYLGGDGNTKLSSLGGVEFSKVKARVKASLKEMAEELAKIYSERQHSKGFTYPKDEYLEGLFDAAFPFEETQDQLQAIKDVRLDMETGKVMDRLICGDVGYGKTEVALRGAFRAVLSGKQVALLCPTTILSQQHYKTCKVRFDEFMVNVAVVNRFKTPSEISSILAKLKSGEINVIIGTHRLLSHDVVFDNLGLLILDEEQRFGVSDKEKIKKLKGNIDVLTMSATPIPRTLHMSLSGIRDISIIDTPPKERMPIQTYVCEYDDSLLQDVVNRELSRGGIALILFNRVEFIYDFAGKVRELLPSAKVGIAHGQMERRELEKVVEKLYGGELNVLISTTLIENGIDLPLANTLFVVDSDKLGLSQLYQLRGRIGRSNKLAYAYLTFEGSKVLTEGAYKRLEAINEFKELGSGFKIAMRDLEIRGAGNVLGREQHGHMEKVGYDMYIKLLEEVRQEMSGKSEGIKLDVKLDIAISAFISENYVRDETERIRLYTEISEIDTMEKYKDMLTILTDAYGSVPFETLALVKIAFVKNLAIEFQIKRIIINKSDLKIWLYKREDIISQSLSNSIKKANASLTFSELPIINFDLKDMTPNKKLDFVLEFLKNSKA